MVNRFLIRNSLPSTKRKADAKYTLCCYRRPAIFINSSAIKARCSSNHAMIYTENGTYTAVRRRALHYCTRSSPEAMPLQNRGVLSAASCIILSVHFSTPGRVTSAIHFNLLDLITIDVFLSTHSQTLSAYVPPSI